MWPLASQILPGFLLSLHVVESEPRTSAADGAERPQDATSSRHRNCVIRGRFRLFTPGDVIQDDQIRVLERLMQLPGVRFVEGNTDR
jgi:hypothetical protein